MVLVRPRVLNRYRDHIPPTAKNIMRGTPWGNRFVIGRDGDREQVVKLFCEWVVGQPALIERAKRELRGCDLVCVCAPKLCHGDAWLDIANA